MKEEAVRELEATLEALHVSPRLVPRYGKMGYMIYYNGYNGYYDIM